MAVPKPDPVRLRPATGDAIGTTAFFRNRILFDTLLDEILRSGVREVNTLFHACSIGAEVYSLVIQYLTRGLDKHFALHCFATDKQPDFLAIAQAANFPVGIVQGCSKQELTRFRQTGDSVQPIAKVKEHITFLPPSDFADFSTQRSFELVCLLNAFVYVPMPTQSRVIDTISSYNSHWLVTTGFHQDSIKDDMQRNGYQPILKNIEQIHNGWTDRLRAEPVPPEQLPPMIFTDWSLRPFAKIPDFEYKNCALFSKHK